MLAHFFGSRFTNGKADNAWKSWYLYSWFALMLVQEGIEISYRTLIPSIVKLFHVKIVKLFHVKIAE